MGLRLTEGLGVTVCASSVACPEYVALSVLGGALVAEGWLRSAGKMAIPPLR